MNAKPGDVYYLATGAAGEKRLALLEEVYGPDAARIMLSIGIPRGDDAPLLMAATFASRRGCSWVATAPARLPSRLEGYCTVSMVHMPLAKWLATLHDSTYLPGFRLSVSSPLLPGSSSSTSPRAPALSSSNLASCWS